jgi:hypothetical protein
LAWKVEFLIHAMGFPHADAFAYRQRGMGWVQERLANERSQTGVAGATIGSNERSA